MKQATKNLTVSSFVALSDDENEAIYKDCASISILDSKAIVEV
ncbi:MAG: hypothetical protein ABSH20_12955 [Tepidisphaeraceae bacterium]|jgi:hypothetical protein